MKARPSFEPRWLRIICGDNMKIELIKWRCDLQDDLIRICNAVDRSYLSNRLPFPYRASDAEWWLDMVSEHDGEDGIFRAITVDGEVVGNISVERKKDVFCRDGELGYLLLDPYRSKGIMTQAVGQICELAFNHLDLLRITGLVYAPNIASQKVLLKNGFVHEGTQRKAVYKNDQVYDLYLYGKIKQT